MLQANLREWFNVPVPKQVHRALPDVQILAQILPHLLHAVGLQNADAALEMPEAFNSRMGDTTGKGERLLAHSPVCLPAGSCFVAVHWCSQDIWLWLLSQRHCG